jgi:hypothetical protein
MFHSAGAGAKCHRTGKKNIINARKNIFPVRDGRNKVDWAGLLTALGRYVKQLHQPAAAKFGAVLIRIKAAAAAPCKTAAKFPPT